MHLDPKSSLHLTGIAASPGIQVGRVVVHSDSLPALVRRSVSPHQVSREIHRLEKALDLAEVEIQDLRERLQENLDEAHAAIFDPHLLLLRDPSLKENVERRIRAKNESAHYAVLAVVREFANQFREINDPYISSRASDLHDVANRICKHLAAQSTARERPRRYARDSVVIGHDLTPSDTVQMDHQRIRAFATEVGGPTSHTAILAKALQIPAVVGIGSSLRRVAPGSQIIVDGYEGKVIVNPTDAEVQHARNRRRRFLTRERDLRKLRTLPGETIDGYRVELSANIEFPAEIPNVIENGAAGIGLFRTEFLYIGRRDQPTEEEQYRVYRDVLQRIKPHHVIFRTLDLGGDKFAENHHAQEELNPFLGQRAIRYCLAHPEVFKTQLRALLRASAHGATRIMFPMVTSVQEVIEAKKLLRDAMRELSDAGHVYDAEVEVGIMVEIPSAALTADRLADEVDFFSIGTNDLIQYTLAADRSNARVAGIYNPYHPAVLRLINLVIDAAQRKGIWVGVCGEMASNPKTALLLIGMGIDELSMGAAAIPEVKYLMRHIRLAEARRIAGKIMGMNGSVEIETFIEAMHEEFRKRRIRPLEPAPETTLTQEAVG